MGIYKSLFFEEDWRVLLKEDNDTAIAAGQEPTWRPGKVRSHGKFEVQVADGTWQKESNVKIAEKKFVKSPLSVMPAGDYSSRDNYSKVSIEWLKWEEKQRGIQIQHALRPGGEHSVVNEQTGRPLRFDGYYWEQDGERLCLKFLGFIYHGCPKCLKKHQTNTTTEQFVDKPREPHTNHSLEHTENERSTWKRYSKSG